ncbi:MAG: VOC family protein [Acidimicrobiales bacterium]
MSEKTTASLGYTLFYVADVESTLTFYQTAFGLERRMITPEGDYGELNTGATTLSFVVNELAHSNLDAAGGFTPLDATQPPVGATIGLVTDDVAGTVAAAKQAGGIGYTEPTEKPWGQTVAYIRDPNGILIEVVTPMGDPA